MDKQTAREGSQTANNTAAAITAARRAETAFKTATAEKKTCQAELGRVIKHLRKAKGLTQVQCDAWLRRNGIKTAICRAEVPYKGQSYSIDTQVAIINLLR